MNPKTTWWLQGIFKTALAGLTAYGTAHVSHADPTVAAIGVVTAAGLTLSSYLSQKPAEHPAPVEVAVDVASQVAAAVQAFKVPQPQPLDQTALASDVAAMLAPMLAAQASPLALLDATRAALDPQVGPAQVNDTQPPGEEAPPAVVSPPAAGPADTEFVRVATADVLAAVLGQTGAQDA